MRNLPAMGTNEPAPGLLERDLVVVTGKGGCGKSTVAAALGVAVASRGAEGAGHVTAGVHLGDDHLDPAGRGRHGERR